MYAVPAGGASGGRAGTEAESEPVSRKGYTVRDLARNFLQVLGETGPVASGKALHFTADLIASGGLDLFQKLCWNYAFEHIGVASPRIFVYLKKKFADIAELNARLPFPSFIQRPEVQQGSVEAVLVLQGCPKRQKLKLPVVPSETHKEEWIRTLPALTQEKQAVLKVWSAAHDQDVMFIAANFVVQAVLDGALEKALFWIRWLQEEDAAMRKQYGMGLTSMERGPATLPPKQRTAMGFFLCSVAAEVYKEFAEKGQMRMHEEFQALLDLYRSADRRLSNKHRQDALILLYQLLTEVPRWRVPAAPSLVRDPVVLSRAVQQAEVFYREVLILPLPPKPLPTNITGISGRKKEAKMTKDDELAAQLENMDSMIMGFYGE
jgi:hypothetical protein